MWKRGVRGQEAWTIWNRMGMISIQGQVGDREGEEEREREKYGKLKTEAGFYRMQKRNQKQNNSVAMGA